jgi:tetratricopeptide (TPR) repeat protein
LTKSQSVTASIAILFSAILLVFGRISSFDFVSWDDDAHVYQNPYFKAFAPSEIAHFWTHAYDGLYIPLSYTLFGWLTIIAHRATGFEQLTTTGAPLDPHVFHIASILFHLLNAALVFLLLRRLVRKDLPALAGTLVFAIHPLQVESVAWISELRGLLGAAFTLAAILLYTEYASRTADKYPNPRRIAYGVSLLLAVCAMLSKPSGVIIGPLVVAIGYWGCGRSLRSAVLDGLPYLVPGIVLVLLTGSVQDLPPGQNVAVWLRPFIAGDSLAFYLGKLLVPYPLAFAYGRVPTAVLKHWWAYADWIVPLALGAAAILLRRRAPYLLFGAVFALIVLLPVLGLAPFVYQYYSTTADRYMYMALVGVGIAAAYGFSAIPNEKLRIVFGIFACWVVVMGCLSFCQSLTWSSGERLYVNDIAVNPRSAAAETNLADIFQKRGDYQVAQQHFLRAVQIEPTRAFFQDNLAQNMVKMGDTADAEAHFEKTITENPNNAEPRADLGLLLVNNPATAVQGIDELQTALRLNPSDFGAVETLGAYYTKIRNLDAAIAIYRFGVVHSPEVAVLWRNLGFLLYCTGQQEAAIQPLQTAAQLDPSDTQSQSVLNAISQHTQYVP